MSPRRILRSIEWSGGLAYAVGLAVTDGCLITGKTTIDFTSKDPELVDTFQAAVGRPDVRRGFLAERGTYRAQIGDFSLYRWLQTLGLTPRKSLTIGPIVVPDEHFSHFTRGVLDGDGSIDSYVHNPIRAVDPEYRYLRLGVRFHSASQVFARWLREKLVSVPSVSGVILVEPRKNLHPMYILQYGKYASIRLLSWLYRGSAERRLERKYLIWENYVKRERDGFGYRRQSTARRIAAALDRAQSDSLN